MNKWIHYLSAWNLIIKIVPSRLGLEKKWYGFAIMVAFIYPFQHQNEVDKIEL